MKQKFLIGLVIAGLIGFSSVIPVNAHSENPPVCPPEVDLLDTLGMTTEELKGALESGQTLEDLFTEEGLDYAAFVEENAANQLVCINQALADGKITENQAERLTNAVENALAEGKLVFRGHFKVKEFVSEKIRFGSFENIAEILGMTTTELKEALLSGQTLDDLASSLGVDLDQAFLEWVDMQVEDINQALANGNLTQEQAQKLLDRMDQLSEEGFIFEDWNSFDQGLDREKIIINKSQELISQTLDALGMTAGGLRQAIQGGQTLEEIAQEKGVDLDEMVHTWITDQIDQVNQAVEDGKITQTQAETLLERLNNQLDEGFPTEFLGKVHRQVESFRNGRSLDHDEKFQSDNND